MKSSHQILLSQLLLNSAKHGIPSLLFFLLLLQIPFSSAQPSSDTSQGQYANMRFSPSIAIIIVVLISALFFMGFFSIYIRHCSNSSGGPNARPLTGTQRSRRAVARGLDQEVLETFPTFVYSEVKQLKIGKGALECAVCLNEFQDDETLRLIPKCDHVFHPDCIDAWLESHTTCPVCRTNLVPEPVESLTQTGEPHTELDLEAQTDVAMEETQQPVAVGVNEETQSPEPQVINVNGDNPILNRTRTRRSRSSRPRKFLRSHSTGHSLVQPGENTERFTLRLPVEVRQQIMNRELNRSHSLLVLPRESSSRRGYRLGGGGGGEGSSSNGRGRSIRWLDRLGSFKSPLFSSRTSSLRSPRVTAADVNETPVQPAISSSESNRLIQSTISSSDSNRLPV